MKRYLVTFKIHDYCGMGEILSTETVVCDDLGDWWQQDRWRQLFPEDADYIDGIAITNVFELGEVR